MEKLNINPEIGNRIAQARHQIGLTQREFAARLKVSQGLVGAWENHTKAPGRETLEKISEFTGLSMDALAGKSTLEVEVLKLTDATEIGLIMRFRSLPLLAKKNVLELLEMTANIAGMQQKKRRPAEVK